MPSIAQLKRAVVLSEKIAELEKELAATLGGGFSSGPATSSSKPAKGTRKGKRTMSPEAREKIAAAQRRRWAKAKGGKAAPVTEKPVADKAAKEKPAKKKKSRMSPEGLAKIKAAQAKRWSAYRKAKKAGE